MSSSSSSSVHVIDGSKGEGGGQILRNAISYCNILQKEIQIYNIRAGRTKPGLKAQHSTCLQLATEICGGSISGNNINSTEIIYKPHCNSNEKDDDNAGMKSTNDTNIQTFTGEIGTAGSICLLLQAALPCALFNKTPSRLLLKGGTNATMAPQYDYWEQVFWPTVCHGSGMELDQIEAKVIRRGFFPKGGGEVEVYVKPLSKPLKPVKLTERGKVDRIHIRSFHAGKLPKHLAVDMAKAAQSFLINKKVVREKSKIHVEIVTEKDAVGSGMGILIVATTTTGCILAGSALSSPKKKAKDVGMEAAIELYETIQDGGCVDEWLQDQLIIFAALANGTSEILSGSLTLHTQTAIWIAQDIAGAKIDIERLDEGDKQKLNNGKEEEYGKDGRIPGRHLIRCKGIGYFYR